VVIVSFNSREALPACLDSLARSSGPVSEVVVVDNASADGSADLARRHPLITRTLANPVNLGFAHACNQGLRETTAPLVLLLNPDATVDPGAVQAMVAILDARRDVGIVGPLTRHADGTLQVSTGPDLDLRSEWRQRRLVRGLRRLDPRILAEVEARHSHEHEPDWVSGSCLMTRREAILAVGGFDEGFFLYEEDADLCLRVRRAGWRVVFTPAAQVCHTLGHSMAYTPQRARLEYHRSHLRYYGKHNPRPSRSLLRLLILGRACLTLLASLVRVDADQRREGVSLVRLVLTGR
jgi:GT2 family glycosyltransferase